MASEKERILKMLEDGKITGDDAARLIEALGGGEAQREATRPLSPEMKGKKLRVKVKGSVNSMDEDVGEIENINVNVAVPLVLAGLVDNIISNVIPKEVNKELEEQGINLKAINLGSIIDALTDTGEDIVNVDLAMKGKPLTVRVYVE